MPENQTFNFEISQTLSKSHPELAAVIQVIDGVLGRVKNDATFRTDLIARSKRIDINRVASVFDLFADEGLVTIKEQLLCGNCGNINSLNETECTQCSTKIDTNQTINVYLFSSKQEHDRIKGMAAMSGTDKSEEANSSELTEHEIDTIVDALIEECLPGEEQFSRFMKRHATGKHFAALISGNALTDRRLSLRDEAKHQEKLPRLLLELGEFVPAKKQRLSIASCHVASFYHLRDKEFDQMVLQFMRDNSSDFQSANSLEGITSINPFLPMRLLTPWQAKATKRICRIRLGKERDDDEGTGFLIHDDLVLTCFHVIEKCVDNPENIYVHFDDGPELIGLAQGWKIPYSKYGKQDLKNGNGEPEDIELDFAILKLERAVGQVRGCFDIRNVDDDPEVGEPIIVCGHPGPNAPLHELMISMASPGFVGMNDNQNRLIYETSTEHGSSGSPVFNRKLRLIGVHHNGGDQEHGRFINNRGIPTSKILHHLKEDEDYSDQLKDFLEDEATIENP